MTVDTLRDGAPSSRGGAPGESAGLQVTTYKRAAYQALREMITELELPPGTRLVESDLAALLRISKTPIREAISLLEADGLVEIAPYRGATVRWITVAEMEEQAFLIDTVEMPAVPRVIDRITPEELAVVDRIVGQLRDARAQRDGRRFRRLTTEYHRRLFAPAGYPRLLRILETMVFPTALRLDRVFSDPFDDIWDIHLEIRSTRLDGIRRADVAGTVNAVRALRDELTAMCMSRLDHPLVAPYVRRHEDRNEGDQSPSG